MFNKKASLSEEAIFQLVYMLFLTIPVVTLIYFIPGIVLNNAYDTQKFENEIYQIRALNAVSSVSPLTKKVIPIIIDTEEFKVDLLNKAFDEMLFKKQIGFWVNLPELEKKDFYFNKEFYDDAKPLTPVRYLNFASTYKVYLSDKKKLSDLVIDQVFSPRVILDDD